MKLKTLASLLSLACIALFCAACGPNNTVPLTYQTEKTSVLPAPSAARVAVVLFTDSREQSHLGTRTDNTTFVGTSSVPEWISRSFAEALRNKGLQVTFAHSMSEALQGSPAYVVTGNVQEAKLTEASVAELRAAMQVEIVVHNPQNVILREGLSASQNKTGLISTSTATGLLQSTVQELLRPGVDKVARMAGIN